jgi:hypothetical protein
MGLNEMRDGHDWIWKEAIRACFQVLSQSSEEIKGIKENNKEISAKTSGNLNET